ncbi:alpha/beta hydrolase domain-containing protein [Paracraurococcus lichenis]|uniref:Alpha/beta hydrolase domain-containing protein n=1 Tax=Paracraurococcus lichenis TaxID=3064888 RepID=A0ABT9E0X2_9PROT|nr:alpha/beta hydrolase domain-containing protein [Paracraurococcus sp. LOR1-02]MDO9709774.1 alpha/beta hydrolase domain-containing protein [Paracraurococcus sp. LOR1-02]
MRHAIPGLLAAGLLAVAPAHAEVTRFELQGAPAPAFGGQEFGPGGRYERIAARATIALDPTDPRNAIIADIALAPRNAEGRVEAVAEVVILRPAEAQRGNGTLLLEVPNRGREIIGQLMNDLPGANGLAKGTDPGNGHLMRQGYTLVWVGWQADIAPGQGMRLAAPVVPGVTGPSREEFLFDHTRSPVTMPLTYPAATTEGATLTVRARAEDARQTPAGLSFRFLDPMRVEITRPAGFDAGALYELIYTAKDPVVQGMAFAAVRDVATFLRREKGPQNPLAAGQRGTVDQAILTGISQSGRFVRDYLHLGFNEDEAGRRVFEAMLPHIPGTRRTFTNARFAQPGRNPTPHADRLYPADQFPFTYAATEDHLTGRRDGLMLRCRATNTCPRIMQTDSEYEFWGARASLLVTDTRGNHIDLPPDVRAYMMTGHPHFAAAQAVAERIDRCTLPVNPLQAGAPMRALLAALEAWLREGVEPPASRYPTRAAGTLVPAAGLYANLPFLGYRAEVGPAQLVDSTAMPPVVKGEYTVLVPRVDADGNAIGGVRGPVIEVPKATYTGWNPRAEGFAPGALCYNTGAVVPFAATRAGRQTDDPRPALEARYPTPTAYAEAVKAAAARLVAERLLLPEDAAAIARAAEADTLARLRR